MEEDLSVFFDTAVFADAGIYTPAGSAEEIPVDVIIDHNVEAVGEYGQVVDLRTIASIPKTQVAAPNRGDRITIGATHYTVASLISDDGAIVQVAVR